MKHKIRFFLLFLFVLLNWQNVNAQSGNSAIHTVSLQQILLLEQQGNYTEAHRQLKIYEQGLINILLRRSQTAKLTFTQSILCREATRSGQIVPLKPQLNPGEDLCIYTGLENFTIKKHPRGFIAHLTLSGKLCSKSGEILLEFGPLRHHMTDSDFKTEVSLVKYITIPEDITPGLYLVKYQVIDQLNSAKRVSDQKEIIISSGFRIE